MEKGDDEGEGGKQCELGESAGERKGKKGFGGKR